MQLNRTERLALLVTLLGDEAKQVAMSDLRGEPLDKLKSALEDFEEYPPTPDEIELVISDFEESFQLAMASANLAEEEPEDTGPKIFTAVEESFETDWEPDSKFLKIEPTGDTIADLNRLHPYQVASVLKFEPAPVIAMVAKKLTSSHAAKTIEELPSAIRASAILNLSKNSKCKMYIEEVVLSAVLNKAIDIVEREEAEISPDQMADLLRTFPRDVRKPLLKALTDDDPELAEQIKSRLFRLADLIKIDDRDVQLILSECKMQELVVALQECEEEILMKVFSNMSKRAKETLQEEMDLLGKVKAEEIELARANFVKLIMQLDEDGKITLD